MALPVARSYFDAVGKSGDPGLKCEDVSLTVQASKDECDINIIVKKYLRTGELPGVRQGVYADLSQMIDLRDAIHMVNDAQQAFMELPAELRREFDNDPTKLVEFALDSKNKERAIALGLIDKPVHKDPVVPPVAPKTTAEAVPPVVT